MRKSEEFLPDIPTNYLYLVLIGIAVWYIEVHPVFMQGAILVAIAFSALYFVKKFVR